jgi:hypothetical protein
MSREFSMGLLTGFVVVFVIVEILIALNPPFYVVMMQEAQKMDRCCEECLKTYEVYKIRSKVVEPGELECIDLIEFKTLETLISKDCESFFQKNPMTVSGCGGK